jgi:hypothetical protein
MVEVQCEYVRRVVCKGEDPKPDMSKGLVVEANGRELRRDEE